MSVDQTTETTDGIILTEAAARKVADLVANEGEEGLVLRVSVAPGGCQVCGTSWRWTTANSLGTSSGSTSV